MVTDSALVMNMHNGDKNAFRQLVERHKRMAFQTALGLVGNRDDAYDISQEAFLRAYRSSGTYKSDQPFLPWFYTIIANLARTWLKKRSVAKSRDVDLDDVEYLMTSDTTPEEEYIRGEEIDLLRKSLLKLPFDDREIITLHHFRNMSYDEIAELLAIPRGTVMSRLYYARKRLARLMGGDHG
ncbi:MAG: RNA polymerase sigma factor [candidate division Zixibacteria bacterium]|nr:RNA polymerase sigma factor [candidate division Zixibacteria bacterium]